MHRTAFPTFNQSPIDPGSEISPGWIHKGLVLPIQLKTVIAFWPWMWTGVEPAFVLLQDTWRAQGNLLFVTVVLSFAYFTAFMETLTISAYPDYTFEDRNMAYTIGSAFYGIYFIVSFPAFFRFDDRIDVELGQEVNVYETFVSSCGHGMMIMILLDFVRLYLDIPLIVGKL